jgi:hypothetical protein
MLALRMTGSRARLRRLLWVTLVGVALAAIVAGSLSGLGGPLAYVLPPLLLLVALAMRRYPGARVLLAVIGRARARRLRAPRVCAPGRAQRRVVPPRGGQLIAFSLAVRPPPMLLFVSLS